ncbi:MAG: cation:proton antiporter [Chloroflexi bacterium]|nr:cation:proton antiporter [Chloroflexota bacterium]
MSPVLQLLVVLAIIITAAKASGLLAVRLGQPAVLGELLAGVVLGPTALDLFDFGFLSDPHLEETTLLLAELGVIFLMFLAGLETDLADVARVRRVAILAGTMGVIVPIVLGASVSLPFDFSMKESIFIGIILSATSVSITARTLMELGVLQGRQGISILAAAVIDDVLAILVLSFFIAFGVNDGGGSGAGEVALIVLRVLAFFAVAVVVGWFVLPAVARWTANQAMSEGVLAMAVVVTLIAAWFAEYVGEVALITGAFLAGLFLRRTEAHRLIDDRMRAVGYGFFVPVFFVGVGLSADAGGLEGGDVLILGVIAVVAVASKLIGAGLGAFIAGEGVTSSLQIGTGMISRGEVGLIIASVGLGNGLIDRDLYSVMVLIVLITTLVTPVLLKVVFTQRKETQHA